MKVNEINAAQPPFAGDILTIGFATTVAMWGFGYFAHLPKQPLSGPIVFAVLVLLMALGGAAGARLGTRGWRGGLYCGLVTGLLNLLVLGSVMGRAEAGGFSAATLLWVPGSVMLAMLCGGAGAVVALLVRRKPAASETNWPAAFAMVTAVAALLLLSVGGMVTGYEAGLAVPDWPNTEGHNMFLYPLAKMTGGIYFEHSHRLLGSLVGLTTIVLLVYVWRVDARRWLRALAAIALVMVIVQGIMGGLRVTGRFTFSTDPTELAPSSLLAIIHGVFGQVFFTTLVAIATALSRAWTADLPATPHASAPIDRRVGFATIAALLAQLITGATVRHITGGLMLHVALAVIVLALAGIFALRSWGLYGTLAVLPRMGVLLLSLGAVQALLGLAALVIIMFEAQGQSSTGVQVLITTLHQTIGAFVLAATVSLLLWHYRLATPEPQQQVVSAALPR